MFSSLRRSAGAHRFCLRAVHVHKSVSKCRKKLTLPKLCSLQLFDVSAHNSESVTKFGDYSRRLRPQLQLHPNFNMPKKGPSQVTPRSYARQAAGLWTVIDATEASVTPRGGRGKENVGDVGANSRMTPRGTGSARSAPTLQPNQSVSGISSAACPRIAVQDPTHVTQRAASESLGCKSPLSSSKAPGRRQKTQRSES